MRTDGKSSARRTVPAQRRAASPAQGARGPRRRTAPSAASQPAHRRRTAPAGDCPGGRTAPARARATERVLSESRSRRSRIFKIAAGCALVLVVLVVLVTVLAFRRDAVTGLEGGATSYIMGQRADIAGPATIEQRDGAWTLVGEDMTLALDGRPLYLADDDAAMFGDGAMVVLPARQGVIRQVPARTGARFENGIGVLESHEGDVEPVESGFIYDGSDVYTLLSEARLVTSAGELVLAPLSCIEAVYGGAVYVYDRGSDSVQVLETGSAVLEVDDGTTTYEVDLLSDTLTVGDTSMLLLGSASAMPSIFE